MPTTVSTNNVKTKNWVSSITFSTWKKSYIPLVEWNNKDEFLDVIYWGRQLVSIVCGIICGIIPLKGFLGVLLFLALSNASVYAYTTYFQRIPDDDLNEYGGLGDILKEGFMTSLATFLVTWIILYSTLYSKSLHGS